MPTEGLGSLHNGAFTRGANRGFRREGLGDRISGTYRDSREPQKNTPTILSSYSIQMAHRSRRQRRKSRRSTRRNRQSRHNRSQQLGGFRFF